LFQSYLFDVVFGSYAMPLYINKYVKRLWNKRKAKQTD